MRLLKGRFRSRKSMKRATRRYYVTSQGRTYASPIETDRKGNRTIQVGMRKYLLSLGPR